jgi:hypothetical protein
MKNEENLKVTGKVTIQVINSGKVVNSINIDNLVVNSGRDWIAGLIGGTAGTMTHMAVGDGVAVELLTDTTLDPTATELARVTVNTPSTLNNITTFVATFAAGVATGAISEAGIFNAASAGDMLCRTTFDVVNIGSADSMSITWAITVS